MSRSPKLGEDKCVSKKVDGAAIEHNGRLVLLSRVKVESNRGTGDRCICCVYCVVSNDKCGVKEAEEKEIIAEACKRELRRVKVF